MQESRNLKKAGFTLVEIIAVLVILGILAAVAVPKYINLQDDAADKAIDAAIAELNGRESLNWGKVKLQGTADTGVDAAVQTAMAYAADMLGPDFTCAFTIPTATVTMKGKTVTITRTAGDGEKSARWAR